MLLNAKNTGQLLIKAYLYETKRRLRIEYNYNGLNWAEQIKQILDEIGMTELWLSQNTTNISIHHIKQRTMTYIIKPGKPLSRNPTDCQHIVGTKVIEHKRYILIKYIYANTK